MQELEMILKEINSEENKILSELQLEISQRSVNDMRNYVQGLRYAKDIIRKHMNDGWIPVEERLPEVGEYVLGTNKYGEVLIYRYGWNSPRTRKMFFHLCGSAANITAWRPLPEPYRPERREK